MIKINLQYFAQVIDAQGNIIDDQKKKNNSKKTNVPRLPSVTKAPTQQTVTPQVAPPVVLEDKTDPVGTGDNQIPDFLKMDDAQRTEQKRRREAIQARGTGGTREAQEIPSGPTQEELNAQLVAANRKRAIDSLNRQFDLSQGRLDQEESAIAGQFRTKEGQVRTADTLARAGTDKFLNIGGLGQAGQVGQSATAQNVITQGAISGLNQQELAQRADIERRRTELNNIRNQGIADINTEIEIQQIESQLRSAEAQAEYEREKAVLAESREYAEYLRQVENADARDMKLFEQELVERNKSIDFEINEARANNDFVREQELTQLKAANDLQLEGIRQAGRLQLEGARSANTLREIGARGAETRATEAFKDTLTGSGEQFTPPYSSIKAGLNNALTDTSLLTSEEARRVNKQETFDWIIDNEEIFINDPESLKRLFIELPYSESEFAEYEDFRERATQSGVSFNSPFQ